MNRIAQEHRQRNLASRQGWNCFASHRQRVTQLLSDAHPDSPRKLCVLGAGNCNDLDLNQVSQAYTEVHLVDLDLEAIEQGVRAQQLTDSLRLHLHGHVDVTGCNEIWADWDPTQLPDEAELHRSLETLECYRPPGITGPFDTVVSVCLLTQLIDSVALSLGGEHPRFLEMVVAVRRQHLRLLMGLLEPAGTALLITDFVSSGTYPALATTSAEELPRVAARLIGERNFFTGTNPGVLHSLFKTDAVIAPQVAELEMVRPWLWDLGPRTYAVCAIRARKRSI